VSGGYGYPAARSGRGIVAAILLFVVAALAVGGSFGAISAQTYGESTTAVTGWMLTTTPPPPNTVRPRMATLHGVVLTVGALLGCVGAVMIMAARRGSGGASLGRSLGIASAALLIGDIAAMWLGVLSSVHNFAILSEGPAPDFVYQPGIGAWLLLADAMVALVVVVLLLVPERQPAAGPQPAWAPGPYAPPPGWPPPPR
jgi:hypothetical protein